MKLAADHGLRVPQYFYGRCLQTGWGVDKDMVEGARYVKMAADQGLRRAAFYYGNYLRIIDKERNWEQIMHYFKIAADKGLAEAQHCYALGRRFGPAIFDESDRIREIKNCPYEHFHDFLKYMEMAAEQEFPYAEVMYGWALVESPFRDDQAKGKRYIKRAADHGLTIGMLWDMVVPTADDTPSEQRDTVRYLKRAVDSGDNDAILPYAVCLYRGLGVRMNRKEAAKWFKLAADDGVPDAQWMYGLCLYRGRGVNADSKKAFEYLEQSAQRRNSRAKYCLGLCLFEIDGYVTDERSRCRQLLRESASYGDGAAQNLLSIMYLAEHDDRMYPLLMTAVDAKNLCATYNYGLYLLATDACNERSVSKSFDLFRQVATQHGDGAEYDYKTFLAKGIGADVKSRWDHLLSEANLNMPESQFIYGKHEYSLGNVASAVELFQKAASKDHAEAKFAYCMIRLNEFGESLSSLQSYFEDSARDGVLPAQYNIGILLSKRDDPKDRLRGARFMQLAAKEILLRRECQPLRVALTSNGAFDEFFIDKWPPFAITNVTDSYIFQQLGENLTKISSLSWEDMTRGPAWIRPR